MGGVGSIGSHMAVTWLVRLDGGGGEHRQSHGSHMGSRQSRSDMGVT